MMDVLVALLISLLLLGTLAIIRIYNALLDSATANHERAVESSEQKIEELTEQLQNARLELNPLRQERDKANNNSSACQQSVDFLREKRKQDRAEIADLQTRVTTAKEFTMEARKNARVAHEVLVDQTNRHKVEMAEQKKMFESRLSDSAATIHALKAQPVRGKRDSIEYAEALRMIASQKAIMVNAQKQKESDIEIISEQLLQRHRKDVKRQLDAQEASHRRSLHEASEKQDQASEAMKAQSTESSPEIEKLRGELEASEKSKNEAQNEIKRLEEQISAAKGKHADQLQAAAQDYEESKTTMQNKLDDAKKETALAIERCNEFQVKRDEEINNNVAISKANDDMQEQILQAEKKYASLSGELDTAKRQAKTVQEEAESEKADLVKKLDEAATQITDLEQQLKQIQDADAKAMSDIMKKHQSDIAQLESSNHHWRSKSRKKFERLSKKFSPQNQAQNRLNAHISPTGKNATGGSSMREDYLKARTAMAEGKAHDVEVELIKLQTHFQQQEEAKATLEKELKELRETQPASPTRGSKASSKTVQRMVKVLMSANTFLRAKLQTAKDARDKLEKLLDEANADKLQLTAEKSAPLDTAMSSEGTMDTDEYPQGKMVDLKTLQQMQDTCDTVEKMKKDAIAVQSRIQLLENAWEAKRTGKPNNRPVKPLANVQITEILKWFTLLESKFIIAEMTIHNLVKKACKPGVGGFALPREQLKLAANKYNKISQPWFRQVVKAFADLDIYGSEERRERHESVIEGYAIVQHYKLVAQAGAMIPSAMRDFPCDLGDNGDVMLQDGEQNRLNGDSMLQYGEQNGLNGNLMLQHGGQKELDNEIL